MFLQTLPIAKNNFWSRVVWRVCWVVRAVIRVRMVRGWNLSDTRK